MRSSPLPVALLSVLLLNPPPLASQKPLELISITPAGEEVPVGRQVVLQFDRAVVPIGRMERSASEVPVTIDPALACEWRWLNTSALACQLGDGEELRPATRYTVRVAPRPFADDGSRLAEEARHTFTTVLPAVAHTYFRTWQGPTTPQIYVTTNQPLVPESVRSHLFFWARGERFALSAEPPEEIDASLSGMAWILEPERPLPADSAVELRSEAGLTPVAGSEPSREEKTVLKFWTFPEARFLGVRCNTRDGDRVLIRPQDRTPSAPRCNPLRPAALVFASPVLKTVIAEQLTVDPDLAGGREDYDPWAGVHAYSRLWGPRREGDTYAISLPEVLRARTSYRLRAPASGVEDEFGRPLPADIDVVIRTDDRLPRAVLTHPISVLERQVETHVPLVVTNLDRLEISYEALTTDGLETGEWSGLMPAAKNIAFPYPLKVRDWLGGRSGALLGRFGSDPATPDEPNFFTQVTPFHVHAKLGHRNSVVWVTDLASGEPVAGAEVRIFRHLRLGLTAEPEILSQATTGEDGVALLAGSVVLDPDVDLRGWLSRHRLRRHSPLLFAQVEHRGELAVLPLSGNFEVRAEGPQNSYIPAYPRPRYGHLKSWGTTAQGVYRLGDTVEFKLYLRDQDNHRLTTPPLEGYTLQVYDPMDKVVHEVEGMRLNPFGAADGSFRVPLTGAVGWYRFTLSADFLPNPLVPMQVLVADFTPAPFRVTTELDGELFAPGAALTIDSTARLHSGGPYGDAQTRVTVNLEPAPILTRNPKAEGFLFESSYLETVTLHQRQAKLDASGDLETELEIPESEIVNGRLRVETAVRDDRGKFVAGAAGARYVGRERFAGIRQVDWLLESGTEATVQMLVIDPHDQIASGDELSTVVEFRETRASRVKGAGNAYLTHYTHEWVEVARCERLSQAEAVACRFTPVRPGYYRLSATVEDPNGRTHTSRLHRWARGRGPVLWETPPGHQLNIEPEKSAYKVGETARFLIRNPFPGARALISVERIGVQHHFTRVLETATEVVELEVTPDHLPGFYFSAVVTSPRVEAPAQVEAEAADGEADVELGTLDLGKPTFRMGYVRVPVSDPFKTIDVEVKPQRDTYRPRERVGVDLAASLRHPPAGSDSPPIELAVAVLDEAVFDLIRGGETAFDPYRGFYELEALDLENFNLLTHLIGIQKFDKKGADAGGGGGAGPEMRSLFKFVSYWNPSLWLGPNGKTTIEFEVPDNLTGWRVLAMAVTPGDRMGLGQASFVVNQPIELRPALPNRVIEGDDFDARFTVMNRTPERRRLTLHAAVGPPLASDGLAAAVVDAEPYRRYPLSFAVKALAPGAADLDFRVESDSGERDALRLPLEVGRRAALVTAANYGTTVEDRAEETVHYPDDIRTDVGRLSVTLSPTVLGALDGAFLYARDYPYYCWEQRLSKGVMASHYGRLEPYLAAETEWPNHDRATTRMLAEAADFQAPNGGMVYWIPNDAYVSPYLSAYTALAFGWLREHGHEIPTAVEEKLHGYLERLLRTDVFPGFYSRGMASSVRAVALAALARADRIDIRELERYRRHVVDMDLFGKAHYLQAQTELGVAASEREEVRNRLLAHANQSGGKFTFSESIDAAFTRILHSEPRSNCAVLSALIDDQGGATASASGLGDIPFKLVRSLTQGRQRRDHWENTQENLFCMQALIDYSGTYESEPPAMTVRATVDRKRIGRTEFSDLRDPAVELEKPVGRRDPGRRVQVAIERSGSGRLYYATRLSYAPRELPSEPQTAGMQIRREYSVERNGKWVLLDDPMRIEPGELVRVDLFLSLPAARNFVVVDDPVPGGLEPVNRQLATASEVDADKGEFQRADASFWWSRDDWYAFGASRWSFYHQELRHDSARFFSDYLPAGNYHLAYVAQAIAPGDFQVLPAKAEEMYDPDVFALGVPARLEVDRSQEEAR